MATQNGSDNEFFVRTVVWATVSFLILEALLPSAMKNLSFLFLMLQSTIIYVMTLARGGGFDFTATTARLLITYIALSALIMNTEDENQGSKP